MFFLLEPMTLRWKCCGLLVLMLVCAGVAGCGETVVDAPPAKVAFESSLFRILDVNVPPGTTLSHAYENDFTTVVMTDGGKVRISSADGDFGEELSPAAGTVAVAEAGNHGVRNVGEGGFQMLALENLRAGSQSTPAPSSANGMTMVGDSASFGVYEMRLADNNFQGSHVHNVPAVAILVKGRILSQGPENKDKGIGEVPSGLKQLDQPGQWVFVPAGETHFVVRLGADPSHVVEVELR